MSINCRAQKMKMYFKDGLTRSIHFPTTYPEGGEGGMLESIPGSTGFKPRLYPDTLDPMSGHGPVEQANYNRYKRCQLV